MATNNAANNSRTSPCRRCGHCCRVVSLDHTKVELRALAIHEEQRLRRDPDHPHRSDIERLLRDVRFIGRHFHRISRRRAVEINPVMAEPEFDGRSFYLCRALGSGGSCRHHEARPFLCEGYPWYGGRPRAGALVTPRCGYAAEVAQRDRSLAT